MTDADLHRAAHEILNSPTKWNRADTRKCPPTEQTYQSVLRIGESNDRSFRKVRHRGIVMQQARFAIDQILAKGNHYEHRLIDYNNDPKTTFADVQKFFIIVEDRIKNRLATQSRH